MKVFLSWSGDKSYKAALAFRNWLPQVIQVIEPFLSSVDILKGEQWRERLIAELSDSSVGIFFITKANQAKTSSWMNIEAGALEKRCPFLVNVEPKDFDSPLADTQITIPTKTDIKLLVDSLNSCLPHPLLEKVLDLSFETYWPTLEDKLNAILEANSKDQLKQGYYDTLAALKKAETDIERISLPLYQSILTYELAEFREKLSRWKQSRVSLVGDQYQGFLEKAYSEARKNIVATCSQYCLPMLAGSFGDRLMAAHRQSGAKVTRFFVFETRDDITDENLETMRYQKKEDIEVYIYINEEDHAFNFPPDLFRFRDFTFIDDGYILGKAIHNRATPTSEWVFDNDTESIRFLAYIDSLTKGSLTEKDGLIKKISR